MRHCSLVLLKMFYKDSWILHPPATLLISISSEEGIIQSSVVHFNRIRSIRHFLSSVITIRNCKIWLFHMVQLTIGQFVTRHLSIRPNDIKHIRNFIARHFKIHRLRKRHSVVAELMLMPLLLSLSLSGRKESSQQKKISRLIFASFYSTFKTFNAFRILNKEVFVSFIGNFLSLLFLLSHSV